MEYILLKVIYLTLWRQIGSSWVQNLKCLIYWETPILQNIVFILKTFSRLFHYQWKNWFVIKFFLLLMIILSTTFQTKLFYCLRRQLMPVNFSPKWFSFIKRCHYVHDDESIQWRNACKFCVSNYGIFPNCVREEYSFHHSQALSAYFNLLLVINPSSPIYFWYHPFIFSLVDCCFFPFFFCFQSTSLWVHQSSAILGT